MTQLVTAFDIETARDPTQGTPEVKPAMGNIVDPAKRQKKMDDAQAAAESKMALDPYFGRVIGYSWAQTNPTAKELGEPDKDPPPDATYESHGVNFIDPDVLAVYTEATPKTHNQHELILLQELFGLIKNVIDAGYIIASFNGQGFDLPFIATRAMILGVGHSNLFSERQDGITGTHLDLLMALTANEPGSGRGFNFQSNTGTRRNLDFYSRRLLGKQSPHIDLVPIDKTLNHVNIKDSGFRALLTQHARADAVATLRLAIMHRTFNPRTPIR